MWTVAPASARSSQVASPRPELAPVISIARPLRSGVGSHERLRTRYPSDVKPGTIAASIKRSASEVGEVIVYAPTRAEVCISFSQDFSIKMVQSRSVTPSSTTYEPRPTADARSLSPVLRIGELSRRVGVSTGTIRAWERRYALLEPRRTDAGYRLYTAEDEARLRELTRLRDQGVATAEAARLAREYPHLPGETRHGTVAAGQVAPSQAGARVAGRAASSEAGAGASVPAPLRVLVDEKRVDRLAAALEAFDDRRANALLDEALAELSLRAFLEGLVLPLLREVGDRWKRSEASTAQEHFTRA